MKKKRGKSIKGIVGLVALVILLAGGSPAQAQQFKWKLQSANPAGAPQIVLLKKMAADIEKMSAGRLKIEVLGSDESSFLVFPGGRTGSLRGILPEDRQGGRHALPDRAGRP
jgi:TRAP-type mannitol/chloroaromatic compound transport system substrate-binding protein